MKIKILELKFRMYLETLCINEKDAQLRSAIKTILELDDLRKAVKEIQDVCFHNGLLKE